MIAMHTQREDSQIAQSPKLTGQLGYEVVPKVKVNMIPGCTRKNLVAGRRFISHSTRTPCDSG